MERCTAPCSIPYMNRINDKSTPMNVHVQTTSQQAGRPRPKTYQENGEYYVRVRGDARLACRSFTSKNMQRPNMRQSRHADAVPRLYASHLGGGNKDHQQSGTQVVN